MTQRLLFLTLLGALCQITLHTSGWAAQPECGDGYLLDSEDCDDGNTVNETCPYGATQCDICDEKCRIVQGATQTCGDGILQEDFEGCDASGTPELDCEYGLTSCEVCLPQCELGAGRVSFCGDGFIDGANREYCDPNHPDFITCPYGEARCQTCSSECTLQETIGPFCGDDIIQDEEDCDDGNTITERCPALNPSS